MKKNIKEKATEEALKLMLLTIKPRSCPFCGSDKVEPRIAITDDQEHITYTVLCDGCGVGIFRARRQNDIWVAYSSAEEAISDWNRRSNEP